MDVEQTKFFEFILNNLDKVEVEETREGKAKAIFDAVEFYFTKIYTETPEDAEVVPS